MANPQSTNRYPSQGNRAPRPVTRMNPNAVLAGALILSSLILGICILIAFSGVSKSLKKLTSAVEGQTFTSSFSSPSSLEVTNAPEKQYFTETEAAKYLNLSVDDIKDAIKSGEIDQYIKTSTGYSISKDQLDKYFEQKAYDQLVRDNS